MAEVLFGIAASVVFIWAALLMVEEGFRRNYVPEPVKIYLWGIWVGMVAVVVFAFGVSLGIGIYRLIMEVFFR